MEKRLTFDEIRVVKKRILASGQTLTSWGQEHGFSPSITYQFFSGRFAGLSGVSRKLGIAAGLIEEAPLAEQP